MRKFLLAIILLSSLSVFTAQAQFMNKGALGIGGSASIDVDPFVLQLSPNAAYYIIDNLGVGGEVSLTAADGYTSFGIGPFVRYYLNMGVFGQAGLQYINSGDYGSSTRFGFGAGYSLFLNDAVAIEPIASVGFGDGGVSFGIRVGVQAYLNRTSK
jgi:hypothetical protein